MSTALNTGWLAAGNPQRPSDHDVNYWLNFVVYAVLGRMGAADQLMVQHGDGIRRMAAWVLAHRPVDLGTLYRGILVEPGLLEEGKWLVSQGIRRFLSYTDDLEVACWFADPNSIISADIRDKHPRARGYVSTSRPKLDALLWHHDWMEVPLPGGASIGLAFVAALHPNIDAAQFSWNARSQGEVLVEAPGASSRSRVEPMEKHCGADSEELDARLTFPPFLKGRYGA